MSCVVENRKRRRIVFDDSDEEEGAVLPTRSGISVPQCEDEDETILVDSDGSGGDSDGGGDESDDFIVDDEDDEDDEDEDDGEKGEESGDDEEEEVCESCSSDSESSDGDDETEDSLLAAKLLSVQVDDAKDAGYGLMGVLNAISTAKYKTLNASQSSKPIPVNSKLGVCLSDGMWRVFKDFIALKTWMEMVGVDLPEEVVLCILQKKHSELRSETPLSGLYVVSIDPLKMQNYRNHLLPLLLAATGVKVVAEVEDGKFLTEPYLTGFVQFRRICFGKGCYGSVGCFCRQKELGTLWGVRHNKSGVVFFVGSSCVCNFNQRVDDAWKTENVPNMPSYLDTVHEVGLDGLVVFGKNRVNRRS